MKQLTLKLTVMKKLFLLIPLFFISCANREESESDCNCDKIYYNQETYTIVNQYGLIELKSRFKATGAVEKANQCTPTDYMHIGNNSYFKIVCH